MSRKSGVLELAVLGLLHQAPMHGYELRKRINTVLGSFRALSYGSLYPCLKDMLARGWIVEDEATERSATRRTSGRGKIVYRLTAEGKEHFQDLLADSGPAAWDDEEFGVHLAFFAQTDADVRLRILEGRRSRLEERGRPASVADAHPGARRLLHPRAAASRAGVRGARGALAERADRHRAARRRAEVGRGPERER